MASYVDAHCHLDLFPTIRQDVVAEDALPIKTITVTNAPAMWGPNTKLFKGCANIRVALGIHPELASQRGHELDKFQSLCSTAKYVGEVGLDGTSTDPEERYAQLTVFKTLLRAIRLESPKIISVHSRGAAKETIDELIGTLRGTQHQVILHWYSGTIVELRRALAAGFYFSVNHKMVSSRNGQQILQAIPKSALLTETDAPFTFSLEISDRQQSLLKTLEGLGRLWHCDTGEVKQRVWDNFGGMLRNAQ